MSLRKAIDDMCKACIHDSGAAGNWKQQTTICTSFDCPLYPVRPVSSAPIPKSVLDDYRLKMDDFPADCGFTLAEGRPIERGNTIINNYQGYPIVVAESMPSNPTEDLDGRVMVLFGDLRKAAKFGDRRNIRIQVLTERYADYDQLGVKATERYDVVVHDLGGANTAGPIVGLVGNA